MSDQFLISNPDFESAVKAGKYTTGQQPCQNFKAQREENGYAEWDNVHCCPFCEDGTTSFCENCRRDHHEGGYETCDRKGL